ncbi:MAG: hypothetical protein CMM31_02285, partial [Rhodospirillaceae bacterium]|nr:hypothetical protein [Rhodospirillaceae bacterium]
MKFPFSLPAQLAWIGPIICRSRAEALPRADARKFLGIPNDATCFYLSLGGGRNPEYQSVMNWIGNAMKNFPNIQ